MTFLRAQIVFSLTVKSQHPFYFDQEKLKQEENLQDLYSDQDGGEETTNADGNDTAAGGAKDDEPGEWTVLTQEILAREVCFS